MKLGNPGCPLIYFLHECIAVDVLSSLLKWTAVGPDREYPLRQSTNLSMFCTSHCVWTRPDRWYPFKRVLHLSGINLGSFYCSADLHGILLDILWCFSREQHWLATVNPAFSLQGFELTWWLGILQVDAASTCYQPTATKHWRQPSVWTPADTVSHWPCPLSSHQLTPTAGNIKLRCTAYCLECFDTVHWALGKATGL